jgi:hypothetical protein
MTLTARAWCVSALVSLILSQGALAQDQQLNIHGESPLPERLAVWADEAVRPLQLDALDQGAIPINISLDASGYVTLVIEDENSVRVRNLVSERFLEAGKHVIGWDGLDEAGIPAAVQGAYDLYPHLVAPGKYQVRGLVRGPVNLRYELSANNAGNPPWRTPDGRGGWLADHTPPSALVFLPGNEPRMLIGSAVAEAGDGLVWTDLTGQRLAGRRGIGAGGGWCGAYLLTRDGAAGAPDAYLTVAWQDRLELWSINPNRNVFGKNKPAGKSVQGIAARNGLVILSLDQANELMLIDAATGRTFARPSLERPRGLAFDDAGRLLAVSGDKLLRFTLPPPAAEMTLPEPEVVIAAGLDDASQIVLDAQGRFYVSVHGNSHQVKVFSPEGQFLHDVGEPGGARLGPYDPRRMDKPTGLAITPDGRLWVAENSFSPKRVSVWSLDGKLLKWMVGPSQYGGGGSLSADKKRFYYAGQGQAGLEFAVDWEAGTTQLANIYFLSGGPGDVAISPGDGNWHDLPQHPITVAGREYMVNAWNSHATRGVNSLTIWQRRDGIAIPVAAVGRPDALSILKLEDFQARRQPEGNDLFAWSDQNDDGKIQSDEVTFTPKIDTQGPPGQINIGPDLTVINANGLVFRPLGFTAAGAPLYDGARAELLVEGLMSDAGAAGGGQAILADDGQVIVTGGPMRGFRDGRLIWTYPSRWPSLDAANWNYRHIIARLAPPSPGLMVGTTHLCGLPVTPRGGDAGPLWAINGNVGSVYLMTMDGLFVATLIPDVRLQQFGDISAKRGTLLNHNTPGAESFWTSINQADDGEVYVVAEVVAARGRESQSNLIHVDGLNTVRRIPAAPVTVTPAQIMACRERNIAGAAAQAQKPGGNVYRVPLANEPHTVDGDLKEWPAAWAKDGSPLPATGQPGGWVPIGELPYRFKFWPILGAVRVSGNNLQLAFQVSRVCLSWDALNAADADPARLLTDATAVEIALATDPAADPARTQPAAGDLRVLISMRDGKPLAVLYRGVDPQSQAPLEFTSAWGKTVIGSATDISADVQAGQSANAYEVAIPLSVLGIEPRPGTSLRADFGIVQRPYRVLDATGRKLRVAMGTSGVAGHDERTLQHVYWHNKATTIDAGPAGDAAFLPQLWGNWTFE